ncbi:hypothetical protein GGE65_006240 [Skermanella aerolata]|uniref:hypothetical protein n=1 Tax=Skermanella aerolata TaxID=393310 RepID=UPI003D1FCABF
MISGDTKIEYDNVDGEVWLRGSDHHGPWDFALDVIAFVEAVHILLTCGVETSATPVS